MQSDLRSVAQTNIHPLDNAATTARNDDESTLFPDELSAAQRQPHRDSQYICVYMYVAEHDLFTLPYAGGCLEP